jgi:hypothetical protein
MIYYDKEKNCSLKPEDIKKEGCFTLIKPHVDKIYVYGNACVMTYNTTVYAFHYSEVWSSAYQTKPIYLHDKARGHSAELGVIIRKPHFIFYLRYLFWRYVDKIFPMNDFDKSITENALKDSKILYEFPDNLKEK